MHLFNVNTFLTLSGLAIDFSIRIPFDQKKGRSRYFRFFCSARRSSTPLVVRTASDMILALT